MSTVNSDCPSIIFLDTAALLLASVWLAILFGMFYAVLAQHDRPQGKQMILTLTPCDCGRSVLKPAAIQAMVI